jgi:hypothetical protein
MPACKEQRRCGVEKVQVAVNRQSARRKFFAVCLQAGPLKVDDARPMRPRTMSTRAVRQRWSRGSRTMIDVERAGAPASDRRMIVDTNYSAAGQAYVQVVTLMSALGPSL